MMIQTAASFLIGVHAECPECFLRFCLMMSSEKEEDLKLQLPSDVLLKGLIKTFGDAPLEMIEGTIRATLRRNGFYMEIERQESSISDEEALYVGLLTETQKNKKSITVRNPAYNVYEKALEEIAIQGFIRMRKMLEKQKAKQRPPIPTAR